MGYPKDLLAYYKLLGFANASSFASFLDSRYGGKKQPSFITSRTFDIEKLKELSKLLFSYIPNYNSLSNMSYYLPIYNLNKNKIQMPNYSILLNRGYEYHNKELKNLLKKYKITRYDFFLAMTSRVGLNPYTDEDIKAVIELLKDIPKGYHLVNGNYYKNKASVNAYLGLSEYLNYTLWETVGIEHYKACSKLPRYLLGEIGFNSLSEVISYLENKWVFLSEKEFKEGRNQLEFLVASLKIEVPQNYFVDTFASLFILYLLKEVKDEITF